ncbi:hypothetical protein MLD38_022136 [Melastoma candidum]|uniref:Uncharacterized protein n=1 Tax=Melastoma candidum TaxID=119954 RepID=A0ACB9QK41_9MYRT|nr:hypothetical protein MLD38_022136 [Melastoma candidum]
MFRGFCLRRNKRLRTGVDVDEPIESPRRKQEGVYMSYTFGPSGRQVKVILLDTRYHRDLYEVMANHWDVFLLRGKGSLSSFTRARSAQFWSYPDGEMKRGIEVRDINGHSATVNVSLLDLSTQMQRTTPEDTGHLGSALIVWLYHFA